MYQFSRDAMPFYTTSSNYCTLFALYHDY